MISVLKLFIAKPFKEDVWDINANTFKYSFIFVKDAKIVCYLYGYPENIKLGFDFGKYEGSYIKLTSKQKLSFRIIISEENVVRYFEYIKYVY